MQESNIASQVFHPWRRYFARMLDLSIYGIPWYAFLGLVLNINISARGNWERILDTFAVSAIMIFVEPLFLHKFGTTPGKAVFGLRVERAGGGNLSYNEGLERVWGVFGKGYGFNIPIYNFVRMWKSYKITVGKETQPWDESVSYTIKDTKWFRAVISAAVFAATVFAIILIYFAQFIPPNRGELTIAQFVENHDYYVNYFGVDLGREYLDKNGEWAETDNGTFWIDIFNFNERPKFQYTVRDEYLRGISFEAKHDDNWVFMNTYEMHMAIAALAFICAQDDMGLFSKLPGSIINRIADNSYQSYRFTEAGVTIALEIETQGYYSTQSGVFIRNEDVADNLFTMRFSLAK